MITEKVARSIALDNGGNLDVENFEPIKLTTGFGVGLIPLAQWGFIGDKTTAVLKAFEFVENTFDEFKDLLTGNHFIGVWISEATIYIDLSVQVETRMQAVKLGKAWDQIVVWDFEIHTAISIEHEDKKRDSYTIHVGGDNVDRECLEKVLFNLSTHFGGCTVVASGGYWAENGDEFTSSYDKLAKEAAYTIFLSVVCGTELWKIKSCLLPLVSSDVSWIHLEKTLSEALHFNLIDFISY